MWCQEAASLPCICLPLAMPLQEVSSWWLKSPPIMVLSESNSALLMAFHKKALFLEVWATYTLTIVSVPLPAACNLINCARPSIKIQPKGLSFCLQGWRCLHSFFERGPWVFQGSRRNPPSNTLFFSQHSSCLLDPGDIPGWEGLGGGREERLTRVWSPSALANWSPIL